jgi:hypothetical protein
MPSTLWLNSPSILPVANPFSRRSNLSSYLSLLTFNYIDITFLMYSKKSRTKNLQFCVLSTAI